MQRKLLLTASLLLVSFVTGSATAGNPFQRAHQDRGAHWHNTNQSWHGGYHHAAWGRPVALIVPPTATMQTEYAWGVGRTQMRPLHHQFGRPVATPGAVGNTSPTPPWPWSTQQLGIYSVRAPW